MNKVVRKVFIHILIVSSFIVYVCFISPRLSDQPIWVALIVILPAVLLTTIGLGYVIWQDMQEEMDNK